MLKGLKKENTNVQVVGFFDAATYQDVEENVAKGLGLKSSSKCTLFCSGGVMPEAPVCSRKYSLGKYICLNGGTVDRNKQYEG